MKYSKFIKYSALVFTCAIFLTTSTICTEQVTAQVTAQQSVVTTPVIENGYTRPLDIVNCPSNYLNKTVKMKAKFDKFSTLGLDYSVAYRSKDDYISFLIKRDDTQYDIPLAEMKLFLTRKEAEKHIDIKFNDEIEITGNVFSDALGDAWIDVSNLTLIKKAPKEDGV